MDRATHSDIVERLLDRGQANCRPAPPGGLRRRPLPRLAVLLPLALLPLPLVVIACSSTRPELRPSAPEVPVERGVASWYGPGFNGRRTANGERYDMHDMTAAHPNLPFGTMVEVRNLASGRAVVVRINDRGPFAKRRIIDLSYAAAMAAGVHGPGTAEVELRVLGAADVDERYTVQVGAFSDADRAVALHRDIRRLYPEVFVHSDGIWNRVQVGLFEDRANAESLRRELAVLGVPAVVVAAH